MIVFLGILLLLILLYLLAIGGRRGRMGELSQWRYAHRGLHGPGVPENSLAAFRAAVDAGFGAELDVHLLADGGLAVMHDSALKRTTGMPGKLEDLTLKELSSYHLEGTDQCIPAFSQVLELFAGQTPLIVELKPESCNAKQLTEAVCQMLDGYRGLFCLESFAPRCVYWVKKLRPKWVRGQLSENFLAAKSNPTPWILKFSMTNLLPNFLTRPDFVAYRYQDRKNISFRLWHRLWRLACVSWTLKTPGELSAAEEAGWVPIFEGFLPESKRPS